MAELLLEIGTEELPAGYIDPALSFLKSAVDRALTEARLDHGDVVVLGTPRRLVLRVLDVAAGQPDREEEVTGPRADVAWDKSGKLTKAGEGFLRGKGLDAAAAYKKETKKGVVMAALVREEGRPADEVLPGLVDELLPKIPFPKHMRWTDGRTSFARPIRWLLCLLDDTPLEVRYGPVVSGRVTYGHRFHFPDAVEVKRAADYPRLIEERGVTLSKERRKAIILDKARALAEKAKGRLLEDEDLLEEVANLVEHPWPLLGRFEERFLEVPKELLLSEMKEHQRYFGIVDDKGALLSAFIVVAGSEPPDPAKVAAGNARVLRARFEDGAFYFHEDRKVPLEVRAERLQSVVFQRQLGTVWEKVGRIQRLTRVLAERTGASPAVEERALRAAHLCKADLVSGVVGEFPELQGIMGRYYALEQGEPEIVARAIEEHYQPRHAGAELPSTDEGALVGLADRLDTIVSILGIGKAPTGSADPFGLRRAAIAFLRLALDRGWAFSLSALVDEAISTLDGKLREKPEALKATALDFFATRLRGVLVERCEERGLEGASDIVDATLGAGHDDLPDVEARTVALASLRAKDLDAFIRLAATFKRVGNILSKARADGLSPSEADASATVLVEAAEKQLFEEVAAAEERARGAARGKDLVGRYGQLLEQVVALKPHVDKFFDDVLVMAEDEKLRRARLGLLKRVEDMLTQVADFTRVQVEG